MYIILSARSRTVLTLSFRMQLKHPLPAASPPPDPYHTGPSRSQTQPSQPIHESAAATVPLSLTTSLPCQITASAQATITPGGLVRMHASVTTAGGNYRAHHETTPTHEVTDRRPQAPPSSPRFTPSHHAPFLRNPSIVPSTRPMNVVDLCESDSPSPPSSPKSRVVDLDSPPLSPQFARMTVVDLCESDSPSPPSTPESRFVDLDSSPLKPRFARKLDKGKSMLPNSRRTEMARGPTTIKIDKGKSLLPNSRQTENDLIKVRKGLTELSLRS